MKKRAIFTIAWTLGFPVLYFALSMLLFMILGLTGFQKTHPSDSVLFLFRIGAWLFWLSPAIGLVLSILGLLPGTKRKTNLETT
jgi:hypothetical protein